MCVFTFFFVRLYVIYDSTCQYPKYVLIPGSIYHSLHLYLNNMYTYLPAPPKVYLHFSCNCTFSFYIYLMFVLIFYRTYNLLYMCVFLNIFTLA